MKLSLRFRVASTLVVFALACLAREASACLRDAPDVRAIQWSTAIVEAKLKAVDEPVELARLRQAEPGKAELVHAYSYQLFTFDVTDVLDGRVRRAQDLKVVTFAGRIQQPDPDRLPCSQHLRRVSVRRVR